MIKAMLGNDDDDDDSDHDSLSEEGGLGGGAGGRKGRRRKQHPTLGGGKSHYSSSRGPSPPPQPSLQTILRQAQPPSIRTGQFHRQQEVKMQSIRGLLLASLSINLVCGFMLATMTGTVERAGREEEREKEGGEGSSRRGSSVFQEFLRSLNGYLPPSLPPSLVSTQAT
jgi:hypothetical protein